MKVKLPFRVEFEEAIVKGKKTMTSRNEQMGKVGDTFEAFGQIFKITKVEEMRLWDVANLYFLEEGCQSPKAFIDIWNKIHHRIGYVPSHIVWTHSFKRAS